MLIETVVAAAIVQAAQPTRIDAEDIRLTASLQADRIEVGGQYEIKVSLDLGDGWTTSDAGIPTPILQIDVPASVTLSGKVLETYRQLSKNEFLSEPFERRFEGTAATVEWTLVDEPRDDETIGLNLVTYAKHEDGRVRFIRRRVDLPIKAGASVSSGERADRSDWGPTGREGSEPTTEPKTERVTGLQIGDHASAFDLPRADGTRVRLDDFLGKSNIVVTTYRAYW
jgi:hypothetical protein